MSKMLDDEYFNKIGMYAEIASIGESILQGMGKYKSIQLDNFQVNKRTRDGRGGCYPPYYYTEVLVSIKVTIPITKLRPVGLNIFKWNRVTKNIGKYETIFNYSSSRYYWLRGFNVDPDYLSILKHEVIDGIEKEVWSKIDVENKIIQEKRNEIEKKLLGK